MKRFENRNAKTTDQAGKRAAELGAPVVLTPDQLETIAAGFTPIKGPTTTSGGMPAGPLLASKA